MRRPSFQFYPGDWSANPNLKRCTFAERGIWLEVMCLMHDQEPYGVLRWPLKEIAQAVGCKQAELQSLARKGVLKGADDTLSEPFIYTPRSGRKDGVPVTLIDRQAGPIWYSSRMVKDEHVRNVRGESGGLGEAPKAVLQPRPKSAPETSPMPPFGEALSPRGSSSSSSASASAVGPDEPNGSSSSAEPTRPNPTETAKATRERLPPCPFEQIVGLYHELLPELPGVRVLDEDRRKAIRALWSFPLTTKRLDGTPRATGAATALTWVREFFMMARENDFVMGREGRTGEHKNWRATLEYLCTNKGIKRVIEQTEVAA